jgi:hypothetical protein
MCRRENASLQQGMNFRISGTHSVILMSVRPGAPYQDRIEESGTTLIYEGHDHPKTNLHPQPKKIDQPLTYPGGSPTQNGKFYAAALATIANYRRPERVRVYEKLRPGIWSYNGVFHLMAAWIDTSHNRKICKFKLIAVAGEDDDAQPIPTNPTPRRIIPTHVKLEVWKRDAGKCVTCAATTELHFDHILPFSAGGTSLTAANVQLLCARHNLQKHNKIE